MGIFLCYASSMFRELREGLGLTRSDLAVLTGRGVNYLLKAEQLCFPTPPVCLLEFYRTDGLLDRFQTDPEPATAQKLIKHFPSAAGLFPGGVEVINFGAHSTTALSWVENITSYQSIPKEILEGWYYEAQLAVRREWLQNWLPSRLLKPTTFSRSWVHASIFSTDSHLLHSIKRPTQYELSKGLAVPASAVHRFETKGQQAGSIRIALEQLIDYVESGEYVLNAPVANDTYPVWELVDRLKAMVVN